VNIVYECVEVRHSRIFSIEDLKISNENSRENWNEIQYIFEIYTYIQGVWIYVRSNSGVDSGLQNTTKSPYEHMSHV